jgi:hypothetical protein
VENDGITAAASFSNLRRVADISHRMTVARGEPPLCIALAAAACWPAFDGERTQAGSWFWSSRYLRVMRQCRMFLKR